VALIRVTIPAGSSVDQTLDWPTGFSVAVADENQLGQKSVPRAAQ
jgi:hypothetical protein